jgi:putative membrane protein insertion efficiency factor
MRLARALATAPLALYRRFVSPALGPRCKYHPSCSHYGVEAIRDYGVLRGTVLAGWRLLRCNPWSRGGFDYVEDQTLFRSRPRRAATP